MDIRLRVSTEVLIEKADGIQSSTEKIRSMWEQLAEIVRSSTAYWEGSSSERHQAYLDLVKEDVDHILRRMKEHPSDLLKMAGIYEEAETSVTEMVSPLKSDVIA